MKFTTHFQQLGRNIAAILEVGFKGNIEVKICFQAESLTTAFKSIMIIEINR